MVQCYSGFPECAAEIVKSCTAEKWRRQGIMMRGWRDDSVLQRILATRNPIQKKRGEGKNRVVLELLLPKPGGHVLSPHFGQRRRWAVIKMGLEDTYMQRVVELASYVDLG